MNPEAWADQIRQRLTALEPERPSPERPPPVIPDHELLGLIGGGSYGDVWLARNVMGRLRAVKVVWRQNFSSDRPYEREFRGIVQFEPISRSHPAVIDVLHVGRDDRIGCFFYVMELADSMETPSPVANVGASEQADSSNRLAHGYQPRTLAADLKREGRLPVGKVVALGVQLADALGHLHRNGLVHRDVKPSNVVFIESQARLADIGLVVAANEARSFVGTEGFIPPEGPGTVQADLFALGRLLYQAATGKDRCEFPELPTDLDQWPDRPVLLELNEVLAKACAAEPRQRHANAAEFAGDLNLILAGRSVRRAYGIERQLRRATWTTAAALALVGAAVLCTWFERHQRRSANARTQQEIILRKRAETAEQDANRLLYTALLEQARATVRSGEMGQRVRVLEAVQRAAALSNSASNRLALRREAVAALALPDLRFQHETRTGPDFTLVQLDPAFQRLAVCRGSAPVEVRSASDGRLLHTLPPNGSQVAWEGRWSSDGRYLAVRRSATPGARTAEIEVWDADQGRMALNLRDVPLGLFTFHPFRPEILVAGADCEAELFDLEQSTVVARFEFEGSLSQIQFSPKGDRFAAVYRFGEDRRLSLLDAVTGAIQRSIDFGWSMVAIDWHPHETWLAALDERGDVHLLDSRTGRVQTLGRHKLPGAALQFSPEGDYLFSGGQERELICWDLRTQQRVLSVGLDSSRIQFCTDQRQCAVLTPEALQWHLFEQPSTRLEWPPGDLEKVWGAAFSPNGRWLAVSGRKGIVLLDWQSQTRAAVTPEGESAVPFFSPDSLELFAYWSDALGRWRITPSTNAGPPVRLDRLSVAKSSRLYSALICSNDLVLTCKEGVEFVALTNAAAGNRRLVSTAAGHGCVSTDNQWLALRHQGDGWLKLFSLPSMHSEANIDTGSEVMSFTFIPRKDCLAATTRSGIKFFGLPNWQEPRFLPLPMDRQALLFFAPDTQTFWVRQNMRQGGLFDTRTLDLLLPLPVGTLPLALSPDGQFLAVSVESQQLQVWDLADLRAQLARLGLDWAQNL